MRRASLSRLLRVAAICTLAMAASTLGACAPGLEGRYRISGDYDRPEPARFQGELHIDDQGEGYVLLDVADQPTVRVPLCQVRRTEESLEFTLDRAYPPARSCDAIGAPITFKGAIGGHVVTGDLHAPDATRIGLFRALRRFE